MSGSRGDEEVIEDNSTKDEIKDNQNICYSCKGEGKRMKREKIDGKWKRVERICQACQGNGTIQRSRRFGEKGWKKKAVRKSYPSFVAPGPQPLGSRNNPELIEKDDEELCYLVGNWKIFQKLSRHRYSTDDLMTTWCAHSEARKLGHTSPLILDIGCGLGSVLLSNSWQFPESKCLGVEAQLDRYEQALRSIEYNIGRFGEDQERIQVIHCDMRDADPFLTSNSPLGYQLITGTPPYFAPHLPAKPGCLESAGCLFELRGGVEVYCRVASKHLSKPLSSSTSQSCPPSVFVLCNTALASSRVYQSALQEQLVIFKRVDVIPRENKPPLFCVFALTSLEWICHSLELFPMFSNSVVVGQTTLTSNECQEIFQRRLDQMNWTTQETRAPCGESIYGEEVEVICVRSHHQQQCHHTREYQQIMSDLGKPSSVDREVFELRIREEDWKDEFLSVEKLCERQRTNK